MKANLVGLQGHGYELCDIVPTLYKGEAVTGSPENVAKRHKQQYRLAVWFGIITYLPNIFFSSSSNPP